jgi:hypothetical protein
VQQSVLPRARHHAAFSVFLAAQSGKQWFAHCLGFGMKQLTVNFALAASAISITQLGQGQD